MGRTFPDINADQLALDLNISIDQLGTDESFNLMITRMPPSIKMRPKGTFHKSLTTMSLLEFFTLQGLGDFQIAFEDYSQARLMLQIPPFQTLAAWEGCQSHLERQVRRKTVNCLNFIAGKIIREIQYPAEQDEVFGVIKGIMAERKIPLDSDLISEIQDMVFEHVDKYSFLPREGVPGSPSEKYNDLLQILRPYSLDIKKYSANLDVHIANQLYTKDRVWGWYLPEPKDGREALKDVLEELLILLNPLCFRIHDTILFKANPSGARLGPDEIQAFCQKIEEYKEKLAYLGANKHRVTSYPEQPESARGVTRGESEITFGQFLDMLRRDRKHSPDLLAKTKEIADACGIDETTKGVRNFFEELIAAALADS